MSKKKHVCGFCKQNKIHEIGKRFAQYCKCKKCGKVYNWIAFLCEKCIAIYKGETGAFCVKCR